MNRCGWDPDNAVYNCGTPCPLGTSDECLEGQTCYLDIICITPAPTMAYSPPAGSFSSKRRCGKNYEDAVNSCGSFCPTGANSDCPTGTYCFNDVTCDLGGVSSRCGYTYDHAVELCGVACPNNTNEECPSNEYCYKNIECNQAEFTDTTAAVTGENRCGEYFGDACGDVCPTGFDSACPEGQFCFPAEACSSGCFMLSSPVALFFAVSLALLALWH